LLSFSSVGQFSHMQSYGMLKTRYCSRTLGVFPTCCACPCCHVRNICKLARRGRRCGVCSVSGRPPRTITAILAEHAPSRREVDTWAEALRQTKGKNRTKSTSKGGNSERVTVEELARAFPFFPPSLRVLED